MISWIVLRQIHYISTTGLKSIYLTKRASYDLLHVMILQNSCLMIDEIEMPVFQSNSDRANCTYVTSCPFECIWTC